MSKKKKNFQNILITPVSEEEHYLYVYYGKIHSNPDKLPKSNIEGKFASLVQQIEKYGASYILKNKKDEVLNFIVHSTKYLWSKNIPNNIFMFNLIRGSIVGKVNVEGIDFNTLFETVISANSIYKLKNNSSTIDL